MTDEEKFGRLIKDTLRSNPAALNAALDAVIHAWRQSNHDVRRLTAQNAKLERVAREARLYRASQELWQDEEAGPREYRSVCETAEALDDSLADLDRRTEP